MLDPSTDTWVAVTQILSDTRNDAITKNSIHVSQLLRSFQFHGSVMRYSVTEAVLLLFFPLKRVP